MSKPRNDVNRIGSRFPRASAAVVSLSCALGLLVSCAGPDPYDYSRFSELSAAPAHPFRAIVCLVKRARSLAPGENVPPMLDEANQLEIAEAVADSLRRHNAFASVEFTSFEAPPARAGEPIELSDEIRGNFDAAVLVQVDAATDTRVVSAPNQNKWWNLPLWLLGPASWILADVDFRPTVLVTCQIRRLSATAADLDRDLLVTRRINLGESSSLNFPRRASWAQYAMNLLIPTPWVPPDDEVAEENLLENYTSLLQREIGRNIKEDLTFSQLQSSNAYPFLHYLRTGGRTVAVLFSNFQLDDESPGEAGGRELEWELLEQPQPAGDIGASLGASDEFKLVLENTTFKYLYAAELPEPAAAARIAPSFLGDVGETRSLSWAWTLPGPAAPETGEPSSDASELARR